MFEPAVNRFGRPVRGAGSFEVGQDVVGPAYKCPSQCLELGVSGRDGCAEGIDHGLHQLFSLDPVRFAVGGNHALVDAPACFNLDMGIGGEQVFKALALFLREQVSTGVQGPPGGVQQVCGPSAGRSTAGLWPVRGARGSVAGHGAGTHPTPPRPGGPHGMDP